MITSFEEAISFVRKNGTTSILIAAVGISSLFVIGMLIVSASANKTPADEVGGTVEKSATSTADTVPAEFENITLTAKSAYVWDVESKRMLFEQDGSKKLPLASITKVMTALVAADYLSDTSPVSFSARALQTEGADGFSVGETVSFSDLRAFMLVASSNDAAEAIAEAAEIRSGQSFSNLMNKKAGTLGLSSLSFENPSGLDIDEYRGISGSSGSARDIALLFDYMLRSKLDLIEATREPYISIVSDQGKTHSSANTNILSSELPGLIGSKTGYTTLAGGNLAAAFDVSIAHPVIIVVLGSTQSARFSDVETLYNATKAYIARESSSASSPLNP